MIKLQKGPKPEVLALKMAEWTRLLAAVERTAKNRAKWIGERYAKNPQIRQALLAETNAKCAYCEAKCSEISHSHVEHIAPKALYPHLTFDWLNLTISCAPCNTAKGNSDIGQVIDPFTHDPKDHLGYAGGFLMAIGDLGYRTIMILDLNRAELFEKRRRELESLHNALHAWRCSSMEEDELGVWFRSLYRRRTAASQEFSAMARAFLDDYRSRIEHKKTARKKIESASGESNPEGLTGDG